MLTQDTLVSDDDPEITDSAYDDPEATVIGNVTVGKDATVLPGAVRRGDDGGKTFSKPG